MILYFCILILWLTTHLWLNTTISASTLVCIWFLYSDVTPPDSRTQIQTTCRQTKYSIQADRLGPAMWKACLKKGVLCTVMICIFCLLSFYCISVIYYFSLFLVTGIHHHFPLHLCFPSYVLHAVYMIWASSLPCVRHDTVRVILEDFQDFHKLPSDSFDFLPASSLIYINTNTLCSVMSLLTHILIY